MQRRFLVKLFMNLSQDPLISFKTIAHLHQTYLYSTYREAMNTQTLDTWPRATAVPRETMLN